jgi:hypothetical protein
MGELKPIISSRNCPVCGERVPWTRYLIRRGIWQKWSCKGCHSTLGFDVGQRIWLGLPLAISLVAWVDVRHLCGWITATIAAVPGLLVCFFMDQVMVVGDRNKNYCFFLQI